MIFCFSGTGNSLAVAKKISKAAGDQIVMMTEKERQLQKTYQLQETERVGFIFPIYWWGIPEMVSEFVKSMNLEVRNGQYVYAVVTFGQLSGNGLYDLRKILLQKKIELSANYEVKMVDNYILAYELADEKKRKRILEQADKETDAIVEQIMKREKSEIHDGIVRPLKPVVHKFYKCAQHQKKFYVTDACIGCGICEKNCPCNAIVMEENRPKWVSNCSFCLKCIHNCPEEAVQHGRGTEHRTRYQYPNP